MSHSVDGAQLMLHEMRGPVFTPSASADAVVGESAAPHYVGAGLVIVRTGHHFGGFRYYGFQQPFGQAVGHLYIFRRGEITLHDVDHHVGDATCRLIGRKSECQFRIQAGEFRPQSCIGPEREFQQSVKTGYH